MSNPMTDAHAIAELVARDVAELPDRNSPEGQPDMMLVTADELFGIVRDHIAARLAAQGDAKPEGDVDWSSSKMMAAAIATLMKLEYRWIGGDFFEPINTHPPAQAVPEGWKPVPIEPVGQMAKAARERHELDDDDGVVDWFAIVADAIAAAPEAK